MSKREPTAAEAAEIRRAKDQQARKPARIKPPATKVEYRGPGRVAIDTPHDDLSGWAVQMQEAFGVDSPHVAEVLLDGLAKTRKPGAVTSQEEADEEAVRMETDAAFLSALQPKSALEATLGVQMLAAHRASMALSSRFHAAATTDRQADCARLMNQTMRTFAAQIEALTKLRSGGKQQVEVRYINVDARTQTVIAGGGYGGPGQIGQQPHATGALGHAAAPGLPVWSEDAGGHVVPIAGRARKAAMQDARGEEPRRSEG